MGEILETMGTWSKNKIVAGKKRRKEATQRNQNMEWQKATLACKVPLASCISEIIETTSWQAWG